jgi:hypothetical protein
MAGRIGMSTTAVGGIGVGGMAVGGIGVGGMAVGGTGVGGMGVGGGVGRSGIGCRSSAPTPTAAERTSAEVMGTRVGSGARVGAVATTVGSASSRARS